MTPLDGIEVANLRQTPLPSKSCAGEAGLHLQRWVAVDRLSTPSYPTPLLSWEGSTSALQTRLQRGRCRRAPPGRRDRQVGRACPCAVSA